MKYQIVLQHSEEDCGAACIATIAKHHGRTFAISRVKRYRFAMFCLLVGLHLKALRT